MGVCIVTRVQNTKIHSAKTLRFGSESRHTLLAEIVACLTCHPNSGRVTVNASDAASDKPGKQVMMTSLLYQGAHGRLGGGEDLVVFWRRQKGSIARNGAVTRGAVLPWFMTNQARSYDSGLWLRAAGGSGSIQAQAMSCCKLLCRDGN